MTRLRGGRSGVRIPLRQKDIIFSETSIWAPQPRINGFRGSFEGKSGRSVKLHPPLPSNAEVKVDQSYRPPVCQHGADKSSFAVVISY